MMRTLLIGLWVCAVALGSTYGGAYYKQHASAVAAAGPAEKLEVKKVKPITAPVISGGQLRGYVSAQFEFVVKASGEKEHGEGGGGGGGVDAETYFMDEAFRLLYSENNLDFEHVEKINLDALTKKITDRVNERMGSKVIRETLVKNLAFIAKENLPR